MGDEERKVPPDEPCKCGRYQLHHWWAAITDAGNEGTDYKRHSREECLTRTERDARRPKPPNDPVRPMVAKLPDADGWWARHGRGSGGEEIKWFRVRMISESGEPPYAPHIYVGDLGQLVSAERFATPLTRWYGPVLIPKDDA